MKYLRRLLPLLLLALLLAGCSATRADDLYALPRRSDIYLELQEAIEDAMGDAAYAAPVSGTNLRAIQQADLDGDGEEEVLVFARSDGEKPLKLHVLKKEGKEYSLLCTIESDGAAFDSVSYVQIDGEEGMELVLSRRLTEQLFQAVSVYTLREGKTVELLGTACMSYTLTDLNADGLTDVFLLRSDVDRTNGIAEYFHWKDGELLRDVEADMSAGAESVKRIITGNMSADIPAVFVASTYDDSNIITDVYAVIDGSFRNVTQSDESGLSTGTVRSYFVYSTDIDGDGTIELPTTEALPEETGNASSAGQYRLVWYSLNADGSRTEKCSTYHNYAEGWYLKLPAGWIKNLCVLKEQTEDGRSVTRLAALRRGTVTDTYLTVSVLQGDQASALLDAGTVILLSRRGDNYYCAEPGNGFNIDVGELQAGFGFITTDTTAREQEGT